jgi:hypothetical protein
MFMVTVHHTSTASCAGWKIVDPDLSTNVDRDSLKLMAATSDKRLFDVVVMTVARGGNTTKGSLAQFPLLSTELNIATVHRQWTGNSLSASRASSLGPGAAANTYFGLIL